MKVLLVYPSTLDAHGKVVKYRKAYLPPLSLATLAALTPKAHTVKAVNDLVEPLDFAANWDLVGLTAMTAQAERAYQLADEFRRRGTKVVMGGMHASALPEEAKQHTDAVVIGEAENIWTEVLSDCERNRLKEFYEDSERPSLERALVPRWDCMDMSVYSRRIGANLPMMPIYTTRGCPYGCKFCAVTGFAGKTYRTRPIASVLTEIEGTGADHFFFVDDNIAAEPEYARELFRALTDRGVRWMSQLSATVLKHPDLLERAARAGCFALFIGLESLSRESLAGTRKAFNKIELYEELIGRMRKAGIDPVLSFIFGFDEDSADQFETTIRFLTKNRIGTAMFWILTPPPGTELYREMQRDGRITATPWSRYDGTHVVFSPKAWSAAELSGQYWEAFRRIYQPPRLFRNILWMTRFSRQRWGNFLRGCFIQPYYWRKVRVGEHPYSGGIGRLAS